MFHCSIIIRHTTGRSAPLLDNQSDIFNVSSEFDDIRLILRFSRQMVTSDPTTNDVAINASIFWIWAVGSVSNDLTFLQHDSRGVSSGTITLPSPNDCSGIS